MPVGWRDCSDCVHRVVSESLEVSPDGILRKSVTETCSVKGVAIREVGRDAALCSFFNRGRPRQDPTCPSCVHCLLAEIMEPDGDGILAPSARRICELKGVPIEDVGRPAWDCPHYDDVGEDCGPTSYRVVLAGTETVTVHDAKCPEEATRRALEATSLEHPRVESVEALP